MRGEVIAVANTTRPDAPLVHANDIEHRRRIAERANVGLPIDGTKGMQAPFSLKPHSIADLPDASLWAGGMIYILDESGGPVPAFSDGANWRRITDRAIAS